MRNQLRRVGSLIDRVTGVQGVAEVAGPSSGTVRRLRITSEFYDFGVL